MYNSNFERKIANSFIDILFLAKMLLLRIRKTLDNIVSGNIPNSPALLKSEIPLPVIAQEDMRQATVEIGFGKSRDSVRLPCRNPPMPHGNLSAATIHCRGYNNRKQNRAPIG